MKSSDPNICPTCRAPIPEDAPSGLCPVCSLVGAASVPPTTAGRQTPLPSIEEIAPHFPELEILELLGAGGMGAVYKARQPQLGRFVALKILSNELAQDPSFVERFNREARVLARLSHPNIVAVFDFGTAGPYCYLLMEHVDGVNLRQAMRTGGFTPSEALALVHEICSALQFAHEEGILHRDIKPENVLIDSKGRVKIADFGIAKMVGLGGPSDVTLTLQGSILGSPHYMAPEQIETPDDVDQRADIYSLGVVLYEMLTGELPIGRFGLPSEKAAMDQRIDEIVLRTLAKEREARYQSAGEVGAQVATVATSPQTPSSNADATASGDSGSARFGLLSAILTGASLTLLFVMAWVGDSNPRGPGLIAFLLVLVPGLISGMVGFFLGVHALGEIRKSEGKKDGLGFTIFAVVTWPICFMVLLILACLPGPMPEILAVLPAVISMLLASFLLIRGLRRWARGVAKKDGQRRFPGLIGTLLAPLGLAFLGPVLAVVVPSQFPTATNSYLFDDPPMLMEPKTVTMKASTSDDLDWYRGAPEAVISYEVYPGFRAEFRLVLYEPGRERRAVELGVIEGIPDDAPVKSQIRIGSSGPQGEELASMRGFTALFLYDLDTRTLDDISDFDDWEFSPNEDGPVVFNEPGQTTLPVATLSKTEFPGDGKLELEVIVTDEWVSVPKPSVR